MLIVALFWVSLLLVFHTWVGYFLILRLMTSGKARVVEAPIGQEIPFVFVGITAYNAAGKLESKLRNTLALDNPEDKLEAIAVSDGPTDNTALRV